MLRHPCRDIPVNQDAFPGGNASSACFFVPQGLFLPSGCIPDSLFCSAGIIFSARMHPWHACLFHRDYFFRPDASLACSFVPQGLFLLPKCISGMLFCSAGIISSARMHLWHALLFHRDASPAEKCIPAGNFQQIRMHPRLKNHPCPAIP